MTIPNQEQSDRWNSGEDGAHWVAEKQRYDRMLAPFLDMLLDAAMLAEGEDLLDVGCGSGATTLAAAPLVAPGRAVGIDLSAPMLEKARSGAQQEHLENVSFERGDAQVMRFDTHFDVVISRFGVMFFEDPDAAFANLRSACHSASRLIFVCWQPLLENEWLTTLAALLSEYVTLPDPGPADAPGMFALSNPDRVHQLLADAGWRDVTLTSRHTPLLLGGGGDVDDTLNFLLTGSLGRTMLSGADPDTQARALKSVRSFIEQRTDGDGVRLDSAVWVVHASA
jgi:SAM-dependent methyltransferase